MLLGQSQRMKFLNSIACPTAPDHKHRADITTNVSAIAPIFFPLCHFTGSELAQQLDLPP